MLGRGGSVSWLGVFFGCGGVMSWLGVVFWWGGPEVVAGKEFKVVAGIVVRSLVGALLLFRDVSFPSLCY